uniref:Uncharacterized protein n=1 Tax=Glossina palpalis gambiensis TaxID=67801 RepID=A0A1B0BVB7_9MUSC
MTDFNRKLTVRDSAVEPAAHYASCAVIFTNLLNMKRVTKAALVKMHNKSGEKLARSCTYPHIFVFATGILIFD